VYVPEHFREERLDVLHGIIEENSFATLVSASSDGTVATHIPFLLDRSAGPLGMLRGHVARANPHWTHLAQSEALVIFLGAHAYVSPSWYATSGRVPTWNYVAVHAYGTPRLIEDESVLRRLIEETVARYESGFERPWDMSAIEERSVSGLLRGIVGFDIPIARIDGKRKLGQNRSRADREGMVRGLRAHGGASGAAIADLVETDLDGGS
jgi:transcriptional regulator